VGKNAQRSGIGLRLSLCGHLGRHLEAEACLRHLREMHAEPTVTA
jgi:hypothetical protein